MTNVLADGDILEGTEMMRYVELVLLYRQPGRVELEEFQRGCSPSIVTSRFFDKDDIAAKYSLQLVAGTFFLVTYSGKATDELLCYFSKGRVHLTFLCYLMDQSINLDPTHLQITSFPFFSI